MSPPPPLRSSPLPLENIRGACIKRQNNPPHFLFQPTARSSSCTPARCSLVRSVYGAPHECVTVFHISLRLHGLPERRGAECTVPYTCTSESFYSLAWLSEVQLLLLDCSHAFTKSEPSSLSPQGNSVVCGVRTWRCSFCITFLT